MSIIAAVTACLLLTLVLVLFFQVQDFLGRIETQLAVEPGADPRLRAIGLQMETLRGRFNGLLAESIEMRLKSLEKSVEAGKVTADDLRQFEELQRDLRLLETYAGTPEAAKLDYAEREHSRYRPAPTSQAGRNEPLINEVLEIKLLVNACLVSIALSVLILVGYYWKRHRAEVRYLRGMAGQVPMLVRDVSDGGR